MSNENKIENETFAQRQEALRKGELNVLRHHWVPVLPARVAEDAAGLFANADFAKHSDGRLAARLSCSRIDALPWIVQTHSRSGGDTYDYRWMSDLEVVEQGFLPIQPEIHYGRSSDWGREVPLMPASAPLAPWYTPTPTEASAAEYAPAASRTQADTSRPLRSRYPAAPMPDEGPLKAIVDALGLDWETFESIEISRTFGITLREEAEHPNPSEVPGGARGIRETVWTLLDPDTGTVHVTSTWTIEEER